MRRFSSQSGTALAGAYCSAPCAATRGLLTARTDPHRQPAAGAERRRLADLELVTGQSLERETLADGGGDDADLELPEAHPEADPRAPAEWHVSAARDLLALARKEALGAEGVRVMPDVGQPVRGPRAVVDGHAGRDLAAVQLEGGDGSARTDPGGRVQPQRLVEGGVEVVPVRPLRELPEQERDRRGGRVVAREEQRHHLVADVPVREL